MSQTSAGERPATGRNPSPYWLPGIVQLAEPEGVIDLGPGHLDPDLLPVALVNSAYARVFAGYGPAALTYGEDRGPVPLREQLARLGAPPGQLTADNVTIAAGTSSALSLLARVFARPGDLVFAEQVSYDLGLNIFRDHGLRVRQLPSDADGIDPQALAQAVRRARAAGQRPAFGYLIPTFHNPTGAVMPVARRRAVVEVAQAEGLLILEDDAYADVWFSAPPPPSLAELAGYQGVIRLGSFSKVLAPGLRLSWLVSSARSAQQLGRLAAFTSGGGLNHLAALMVSELIGSGELAGRIVSLREELRVRRDTLVGGLRAILGDEARIAEPGGGFFLWLRPHRVPPARSVVSMLAEAYRYGVGLTPGARFGRAGRDAIRVCYSFQSLPRLTEAIDRLDRAWRR